MHVRNTVVGGGLALLLVACGGSSPAAVDGNASTGNPADMTPATDDSAAAAATGSAATTPDPDALQARDGTPIAWCGSRAIPATATAGC